MHGGDKDRFDEARTRQHFSVSASAAYDFTEAAALWDESY